MKLSIDSHGKLQTKADLAFERCLEYVGCDKKTYFKVVGTGLYSFLDDWEHGLEPKPHEVLVSKILGEKISWGEAGFDTYNPEALAFTLDKIKGWLKDET